MKKFYFTCILVIAGLFRNTIVGQGVTQYQIDTNIPITAVSFPKEVIPTTGGRIEFLGKIDWFFGGYTLGSVSGFTRFVRHN